MVNRPPEGLGDALLLVDAILDTAKDLKASLNQAKRAHTPAALAAASQTLPLSRTLVGFSRDAFLLLSKSVPAWLPSAPSPKTTRAADAKSTARSLRASFSTSDATKKPSKLAGGLATETAAAAEGKKNKNIAAAPASPETAKQPDALEALEAYGTPLSVKSDTEDLVPRDSESSPTPTAKTTKTNVQTASQKRPNSASVQRVSVMDSATAASRARARTRPVSATRGASSLTAGGKGTPAVTSTVESRFSTPGSVRLSTPSFTRSALPSPRLERSTASTAAVSETLMVRRAGIGRPSCLIHRRRVGVSPDQSALEVMDLLKAVQIKLAMGAPVASLVDVATGAELSFAAYAEAKDRAFPTGTTYMALTAAEMRTARVTSAAHRAPPRVPKVPKSVTKVDDSAARAAARRMPLAMPSPRRLTALAARGVTSENANEEAFAGRKREEEPPVAMAGAGNGTPPQSPLKVAAASPRKPMMSPAANAAALLRASSPSKRSPGDGKQMRFNDDDATEPAVELKVEAAPVEPKVEPKVEPTVVIVEPVVESRESVFSRLGSPGMQPKAEPKVEEPKAEAKVEEPVLEPRESVFSRLGSPGMEPKAEPTTEPKAEPKVEEPAENQPTKKKKKNRKKK